MGLSTDCRRAGQPGTPRSPGHDFQYLKQHGLEPAPERSRKTTWKEFLTRQWELIVAADFFTIEVWSRRGLQRLMVLFFIDLATRKVEIAAIGPAANGLWMSQIARNLTAAEEGILNGKRYLIHDRDPLFTAEFLGMLADAGGSRLNYHRILRI